MFKTIKLSSDLVQIWLTENGRDAILGGRNHNELSVAGIASYQPSDGLADLKLVIKSFSLFSLYQCFEFVGLPSWERFGR